MSVVSLPGICYLLSGVMSSPVILSANAFIQFREYKEEKHSLIHPARLALTVCSLAVLGGDGRSFCLRFS
jgi:hypothetical protein